ncbi:methyl-accepting chemotaxis protein [Sphingomonas sp.]|uniref:methyl-accepting chemotaxis protein n=1 Tax=Sphingomonas sp. TaxID=28214 RepID=UPI0025EB43C6|nr:methyl-accepting chemotaxis protein [Sphingomonas sp.]
MSVSNRIVLGFAIVTALLVALGFYSIGQVGRVRATLDAVVKRDMGTLDRLDAVQSSLARMVELRTAAVRRLAIGQAEGETDPTDNWRRAVQDSQDGIATLRRDVDSYIAIPISADRTRRWTEMAGQLDATASALTTLRTDVEAQFAAISSGDRTAMLAQEPVVVADRARVMQAMTAMRETLKQIDEAGLAEGARVYESSRLSVLLWIVAAVAVSIGVTWAIRRSVIGPLAGFMAFSEHVGAGDLTRNVETGKDELGKLGQQLNQMVEGLRGLARQSRGATENLNAAATEIRASTQQQAASVEEQLAAIQETAATVDEITHSGTQISRRAQAVIAAAQETTQTTEAGIVAIEGTVQAMDLIREQAETVAQNIVSLSEKTAAIGDIISTVNDISERAHLLALNAAIEAAAAGEQGRSFAIVAAELKTLADQAKDSTRQVRSLLGEIQRGINGSVMLTEEGVKRVAAGKERTDTAQATIEEMSARIQESVQTFQQIVASTNQQQIGIEQVTLALQNIRQASQQTASSTRQLDQAALDLANLAQTLLTLTERYRI